MDFKNLKDIIVKNEKFLLTTHVNPDGDAIGSEIAFYNILKLLNKKVEIINSSSTPYYLQFLDEQNIIQEYNEDKAAKIFLDLDVIVVLDLNQAARLTKLEKHFTSSKSYKICIDHHQEPQKVFDLFLTDTTYAATGHIIYNFIKETGIVEFTKEIAIPIYAAIMTDTGSFRFDRTTSEIHKIAAHLLELGADPQIIYRKIYDESRLGKIKLLGEAISSIQLFGDKNELAVMIVNQDSLLKNKADESDTDGFVNVCLSIDSVKAGLKFLELKDGFKISLRSKGEIPIHKLAAEFGGGGHKNAAGIRIKNQKMDDFIPKFISKTLQFLNNNYEI